MPWPVATLEPGTWLTLDGTCGDPEVGLFIALVADYNNIPPDALATAERLIAPGGLMLTDTTTEIVPGCCSGLEDWRDWARVLTRSHLADLLRGVHHQLTTFTTALAARAARHTTDGPALTATIDAAFALTAPLTPVPT